MNQLMQVFYITVKFHKVVDAFLFGLSNIRELGVT